MAFGPRDSLRGNVNQFRFNLPNEVGDVVSEMVLYKGSQRTIQVKDALIIEKFVCRKGDCRPRVCCLVVLDSPHFDDHVSPGESQKYDSWPVANASEVIGVGIVIGEKIFQILAHPAHCPIQAYPEYWFRRSP